jgi:hypothetical protein
VLASNRNNNAKSPSINTTLSVSNLGNQPLSYADVKVRYWFTADGPADLKSWIDYAQLGKDNLAGSFTRLGAPLNGADAYLEFSFAPTLGALYPLSSTGSIQSRITKADWSSFTEANDFSYRAAGPLAENDHITVYYQGQLVYGTEPAATAARTTANSAAGKLQVTVLGNPVTTEQAGVEIRGAQGQAVQLQLLDFQGQPLLTQRIGQAIEGQRQLVPLSGLRAGVYLLHVVAADQTTVVRIFKQ